jgi:hypothetical protein
MASLYRSAITFAPLTEQIGKDLLGGQSKNLVKLDGMRAVYTLTLNIPIFLNILYDGSNMNCPKWFHGLATYGVL